MKVLVTGAAGLCGVHLVNNLAARCDIDRVFGVDNYSCLNAPKTESSHKLTMINKSYQEMTVKELNSLDINAVVHLAGYSSMAESMETPEEYFLNNEYGFFKFMQALQRTKNKPLLVYSSCYHVYGKPLYLPVDTGHPLEPDSILGVNKLAGEKYCRVAYRKYGYPVVIVRHASVFGPHQSMTGYMPVILKFIISALKNESLIIHNDGNQMRDFIFVGDAVKAYELILLQGQQLAGKIFNIGTGQGTSIKDLANRIISLTGSASETIYLPEKTENSSYIADISEFVKKTGWQPGHTLTEGLRTTLRWVSGELGMGNM